MSDLTPPATAKRVAVLVSGGGTNLQAIIDWEVSHTPCPYRVVLVISSTKHAFALKRSQTAGIECATLSPVAVMGEAAHAATREQKNAATSKAILDECLSHSIDLIVLAGYLSVLQGEILSRYEGRIINLHPALLPAFGGVGMWGHHVHEAVIASGASVSGCTVHLVDAGCDTGRILVQKRVSVLPSDDATTLAERIAPLEHEAIVEGLLMLCESF